MVICDIHPSDQGSALRGELIEEEYLGVIIFSAVYESEWWPWADIGKVDIASMTQEISSDRTWEYIPSHLTPTDPLLEIVHQRAECIFLYEYLYIGE